MNFTARTRCDMDMGELGATITCANYTKFLGLTIQNDSLGWSYRRHNKEI